MSGVKCINKLVILILCLNIVLLFCGCGDNKPKLSYESVEHISSFAISAASDDRTQMFAQELCVMDGDVGEIDEPVSEEYSYGAAALFDIRNSNVIFSKNAFVQLYPASLTKVMTAVVAMKYGKKDDVVVCSENVKIDEAGAQLCNFEPGDVMTLDQAMNCLLIYSGNDAAVAIAENIAGSVEDFCKLMNEEAKKLGATNSNFVNPNGLHDENHYTTAYDMYLIFNEAVKYEWFNDIIRKNTYTTSYTRADGSLREITYKPTNQYLSGAKTSPSNVTVLGGKTGTTRAAMSNLVLLSQDSGGYPYISIVMKATTSDYLYEEMSSLLKAASQ